MSVSSEVTRIEADRNTIRNTLLAWGLAQATDNLDDLADALAAVVNRGAVAVELDEGETYTVPQGYHNGSGAVTNGVRAGRLEPSVYDYNSGYVSNGSWIYENPTNTYVDIYRVVPCRGWMLLFHYPRRYRGHPLPRHVHNRRCDAGNGNGGRNEHQESEQPSAFYECGIHGRR